MKPSRSQYVQSLFERITPRYDLVNDLLSLGMVVLWRRRTLQETHLSAGQSALDLCAGTGSLSVLLARQVGATGRVVGLDFCAPMLADACRRFPTVRYPQLTFVQGDAHYLDYPEASWHAVTMAFGLRNLDDPGKSLAAIYRVLKPGGKVLILELTRPATFPLNWLYGPYLRLVVPLVGGALSGDWAAYRYLSTSIANFLGVDAVCKLMREIGFRQVQTLPLTGGICTLLTGER